MVCRYDVSAFINKRTGENGEPEVRVRFAGFGSEEDEWVNIATAVRQRSLPCETTECVAVLPGDLILCFQVGAQKSLTILDIVALEIFFFLMKLARYC